LAEAQGMFERSKERRRIDGLLESIGGQRRVRPREYWGMPAA